MFGQGEVEVVLPWSPPWGWGTVPVGVGHQRQAQTDQDMSNLLRVDCKKSCKVPCQIETIIMCHTVALCGQQGVQSVGLLD